MHNAAARHGLAGPARGTAAFLSRLHSRVGSLEAATDLSRQGLGVTVVVVVVVVVSVVGLAVVVVVVVVFQPCSSSSPLLPAQHE
jgi:hypothetical protein